MMFMLAGVATGAKDAGSITVSPSSGALLPIDWIVKESNARLWPVAGLGMSAVSMTPPDAKSALVTVQTSVPLR